MNATWARSAASAAIGAILLLGFAGCGTENDSADDLKGDSAGKSFDAWQSDFKSCMKGEGIEVKTVDPNASQPDGGGGDAEAQEGPADISIPKMQAAEKKCMSKVGQAPLRDGELRGDEMQKVLLVFAKCMRDAGYDYPDPTFDGGMVGMQANSDAFAPADVKACRSKSGFTMPLP